MYRRLIALVLLLSALVVQTQTATADDTQTTSTGTTDGGDTITASVTVTAFDSGYSVSGYLPSSGGGGVTMLCYYCRTGSSMLGFSRVLMG